MLTLIFIGALILPGTLLDSLSPWGVRPDLLMLWTVYWSLYSQPRSALMGAFIMGLLTDLYIGSALGQYTLTLCIVALVSVRLQKSWDKEKRLMVVMLVFAVTLAGQTAMALLAALAGLGWSLAETIQVVFSVAVYNALLVLPTFSLVYHSFTKGWLCKRENKSYYV